MKLRPSVKKAMEQIHIEKLKRNQIKPINAILDGHDTLVIAPTGFGKSPLYQIPTVIQENAITIVGKDGKKLRKLEQLREFLQSSDCCVQALRRYFGEDAGKRCKHCSRCKRLS